MTAAHPTLDAAIAYAQHGWRVVPIRPHAKTPAINNWVEAATRDLDLITEWWQRWPDHGVGIVTGTLPDGRVLFVVDIDEHDPSRSGSETLLDLEATYQPLPDTVTCLTPTGGRHLYFHAPPGTDIRNDAGRRLGPGLDIRAIGGQVLAPPTIHPDHPNGPPYTWEASSHPDDIDVADAPQWLLELLTQPVTTQPRAERLPYLGTPRPGDRFASAVTWPELLGADGATFIGRRRDHRGGSEYELWARPGVDHTSATLYYGGTDLLKVFSSNWPGLTEGETYSRFGYLVATRYAGDFARAAADLAHRQAEPEIRALTTLPLEPAPPAPQTQEPVREPLEVRWVHELDGQMPEEPPVLIDGLIRQGELAVLGAPRAIGKSWLAMNLAAMLARGEGKLFGHLPVRQASRVLLLQGELDEWGSATRWLRLTGSHLPPVAESFDRRIRLRTTKRRVTSTHDGTTSTDEHVDAVLSPLLEEAIVDHRIDVVILDPWATYFAGNENSNDEVEAALDKLRGLTLAHGVSWVIFHHLSKATEYREPEDAWRGASRLADWASTRITILPHYTARQADDKGLKRHEARRYVDTYVLRRSEPTPDFSMHLGPDGWWRHWVPDEADEKLGQHGGTSEAGGRPPTIALRQFLNALISDGARWDSIAAAADSLGISRRAAQTLAEHAHEVGLVVLDEKNATKPRAITATPLGIQKSDRFIGRDGENEPHGDDTSHSRETTRATSTRAHSRETPARVQIPWSQPDEHSRETSLARNPPREHETPGQEPLARMRETPLLRRSPGPNGPAPDEGPNTHPEPPIEELLG